MNQFRKLAIMVFVVWAGYVTYKVGTPIHQANAATFSIAKQCSSVYENQSSGGIFSGLGPVYTSDGSYFRLANPNAASRLWAYSTCNPGDVMIGARLVPFQIGNMMMKSLGLDVWCCKL